MLYTKTEICDMLQVIEMQIMVNLFVNTTSLFTDINCWRKEQFLQMKRHVLMRKLYCKVPGSLFQRAHI